MAGALDRGSLAARLHATLPQTQCTRCGYVDCKAYAAAMAGAEAPINQCPPGGAEGIVRLAALTGQAATPLNPGHGSEGPRALAVIDEAWCIGCTLCLEVCPTDAILGSNKRMHTVIEPYCTGCELCIPVCPVDCISLENATGERTGWSAWSPAQAAQARERYESRQLRTSAAEREQALALAQQSLAEPGVLAADPPGAQGRAAGRRTAVVAAALEKARARRSAP